MRYGARVDRSTWTGESALSPRFSLEVRPRDGFLLRCAAGRFVQFPRQEQVFLDAGEPLRRQVADHTIAGFEISWKGGTRLVVEGYRKDLTQPIGESVNRYVDLQERLTQFDGGRAEGAELTLAREAAGRWSWAIAYARLATTQSCRYSASPRSSRGGREEPLQVGVPCVGV